MKKRSHLEVEFQERWTRKYPNLILESEVCLIPKRRFRFDFVHQETKTAIEINGMIFRKGGHSSGVGITKDYEKLNLVQLEGYEIYQLSDRMFNPSKNSNQDPDYWLDKIANRIRLKLDTNKWEKIQKLSA